MGQGFPLECDTCDYQPEPSGPWEFYRDGHGKLKDYGHPTPNSPEAAEVGIHGFYAIMYCPGCGKLRKLILEEYDEPVDSAHSLWSGAVVPEVKYQNEDDPACPRCDGRGLILRPDADQRIDCPKCAGGTLQLVGSWIS